MNIEARAIGKALKRQAAVWIAGTMLVVGGLAIDTHGFTKPPTIWWGQSLAGNRPE